MLLKDIKIKNNNMKHVRQLIRKILIVALLAGVAACSKTTEQEYHDSFLVFGTIVEISLVGIDKQQSELIFKSINSDLKFMQYAFHAWNAGPIGRVNQLLAATGEFSANPSIIPLLNQAKALSTQSKGYFNPGIGRLMSLWGYHDDFLPEGPPPSSEDIQALVDQKPSLDDLSIRGVRVKNINPALQLDFGGIAKGYALERIIDNVKQLGVEHMIINAGGDIKAIGQKGNKPWSIGIRNPRAKEQDPQAIASVQLHDGEAIFTSGDYERFYDYQGQRFHHILNPFTGYPAMHTQSVTVIHSDATTADAAATALFVAGPENWREVAISMSLKYVMLIDAQGNVHLSEAMNQRLQWEIEQPLSFIIVLP